MWGFCPSADGQVLGRATADSSTFAGWMDLTERKRVPRGGTPEQRMRPASSGRRRQLPAQPRAAGFREGKCGLICIHRLTQRHRRALSKGVRLAAFLQPFLWPLEDTGTGSHVGSSCPGPEKGRGGQGQAGRAELGEQREPMLTFLSGHFRDSGTLGQGKGAERYRKQSRGSWWPV